MITGTDLIAEAKRNFSEVAPEVLAARILAEPELVLIDVREAEERQLGSIAGAKFMPRGNLEIQIEALVLHRNSPLVIFCAGGNRSILAVATLAQMGYENVTSLAGGFSRWSANGLPVESASSLSEAERSRYARHLVIPEIGERGQIKLLAAKVLLVGAGGLGSPIAYYLAAAGVGTLGILDSDVVENSNLQRQILHAPERIGMSKTESAQITLNKFSPTTKLIPIPKRLTPENAETLFRDYDFFVDGSDNFDTRYLINEICLRLKKPFISGSVHRFDGTVSVFDLRGDFPCYRCLFAEPPPRELSPSCATAGVLGVLPGIIGLLQANETIKLILKIGDSLAGRLLSFNALSTQFKEFKISRNPKCRDCGRG